MGLFGLPAASLAVLPERAVAVSWTSFVDAENPTAWVSVVTPESDGTWAEPIDLAPGAASFFPRVVVDHDELWVVYSRMDGTAPTWSIEARRYDDGWGEPETVHAAEGSPPLIAEVVATDHGIVVFTDVAEGGGAVLAHARTEAGWTTEGVGGSAVHAVASVGVTVRSLS